MVVASLAIITVTMTCMVAMTIELGFCYRKFIELVAHKGPSLGKLVIQREEILQVEITGTHNN